MSGIICGEHLRPSHYRVGSSDGGISIDMLEVEMRIQVQYRSVPPEVLYDVGLLHLIRQSNIDQWLDNSHKDFQNLLIWYLDRRAKEMQGAVKKGE